MTTRIPPAEYELREVLRHIKHAVWLGNTQVRLNIPMAETRVTTRLRAMGFGVDCDHYDGYMDIDWSDR